MRIITFGLLASTVGAATLLHFDRMSPMALDLVEIESAIGLPLPAVLGGLTLLAWLLSRKRDPQPHRYRRRQSTAAAPAAHQRHTTTFDPSRDWLDQAKDSAKAIPFPAGARLEIDASRPCPIELKLEQAPPERAKRAIGLLARWMASIPRPPRARVSFHHCPEGGSPRHHQVAGALADHIQRGEYRTTTDLDAVNIIFHHPDQRWTN